MQFNMQITWKRATVDCLELYCKDHHGTCYYPCSLGLPHPRNILGELFPELKKREISGSSHMSACALTTMRWDYIPNGAWSNYLGDPYKLRPFYMASICSPYTNFVLQQIGELAANYAVDGFLAGYHPARARRTARPVDDRAASDSRLLALCAERAMKRRREKQLPVHPTAEEADRIFEFMTAQGG